MKAFGGSLEQASETTWRIDSSYKKGMRVDGLIFSSEELIEQVRNDQAPEQVANVAFLPGIQSASLAMPDIHWGYGFCIGGVAATDPAIGGVVSPGGVGYDINCGVRLVNTDLEVGDIASRLTQLVEGLFARVPVGVGRGSSHRFSRGEFDELLANGPAALVDRGLATTADIEHTEAGGRLEGARADYLSERAYKRGAGQCGSLGSGNHFIEVQAVDRVVDTEAAARLGLRQGGVCIMIHSGSRGLGYQVCDDALKGLRGIPERYGIALPDRQLACAPVASPEGEHYLGAMAAAANFAWCNRQLLMHQSREAFAAVLGRSWESLGMRLVYDVAHNTAKLERHTVDGAVRTLLVHRKGATRAFPPGHPEIPTTYREIGQPVLIPGDMGRASWVLAGRPGAMERSFGSSCHGAGRAMSRTASVTAARGRDIGEELARRGIVARSLGWKGLAEEHSDAYKDVDAVVDVVDRAGLSAKVARLRPLGVIKG
jgi:tRNA-splicing ligase RtcB